MPKGLFKKNEASTRMLFINVDINFREHVYNAIDGAVLLNVGTLTHFAVYHLISHETLFSSDLLRNKKKRYSSYCIPTI